MNLGVVKIATFHFLFLYKFHRDFNQPADWLGNSPERHGGDWIVESPPKICQMPTFFGVRPVGGLRPIIIFMECFTPINGLKIHGVSLGLFHSYDHGVIGPLLIT